MFAEGWASERWRAITIALFATLFGMLTSEWIASYSIATLFYLGWHMRQLYRIERWLRRKGTSDNAPVLFGIWDTLVNHIFHLHKRQTQELGRLQGVIDRFEEAVEALPDATIIIGSQGDIRWANPAAEHFLGIQYPGDLGVRLVNLIREPEFVEFLSARKFDRSLNMSSPANEDIHLNVRVVPYADDGHLITARDISELIRADAMRRDFVSNASHELKTPLTVMTGYMELLEDDPEMPQDLLGLVRSSSEQTLRMRQLVDDLLTLSRLDSQTSVRHEPVMVASILESAVIDARQVSGDDQHQITLDADNALQIEGNYRDLVSAFSNLVFNAVAHTPAGTSVNVSWAVEADHAVMQVRDNGPGIAPHHLGRLTERFYRVQAGRERDEDSARKGRGTGLGLAITKHIVQAHGGYLEINSEEGVGSSFACYFPLK